MIICDVVTLTVGSAVCGLLSLWADFLWTVVPWADSPWVPEQWADFLWILVSCASVYGMVILWAWLPSCSAQGNKS